MNTKVGTLHYDEGKEQYSIVGNGTIVRATLINELWHVEVSYGHNWEFRTSYGCRVNAIARMVHLAWEIA